jgi:alpha-tubulin suppressor-like RCC1 family protein
MRVFLHHPTAPHRLVLSAVLFVIVGVARSAFCQAPVITSQPASRAVAPGLATTIQATATGTNLSYQWQLNGADVPGATRSSLALSNISASTYGTYNLIVTNGAGTMLSSNAVVIPSNLAIWGTNDAAVPLSASNVIAVSVGNNSNGVAVYSGPAPALALRPDGQIVLLSSSASGWGDFYPPVSNAVAVAASDGGALVLLSDGKAIAGGSEFPPSDAFIQLVGFSLGGVGVKSDGTVEAWSGVYPPADTNIPPGLSHVAAVAGGYMHSVALKDDGTVVGWGWNTNELKYQPGPAFAPSYLPKLTAVASGTFHNLGLCTNGNVVIWGSADGAVTNIPPTATNVCAVSANHGMSAVLRRDGTIVCWGKTSSLSNVPPVITNAVSVAVGYQTAYAVLNDGKPLLTKLPVGTTAYIGRDYTFTASAAGVAPISFQWSFNGTNIADATDASLTLSNLSLANDGLYAVAVSNALGIAQSITAHLKVSNFPSGFPTTAPPPAQTNLFGTKVILVTSAIGNGPMRYQWQFNGTNLPGATNSDLVFDSFSPANSGIYSVSPNNGFRVSTTQFCSFLKTFGPPVPDPGPPVALSNTVSVAMGGMPSSPSPINSYFALSSDGRVTGWGPGASASIPPSLTNSFITAISGTADYCVGLRQDGTVAAWGNPILSSGVTNVPSYATNIASISVGGYLVCAVQSNGNVVRWPGSSPAFLTNVAEISQGGENSLALHSDGTVISFNGNSLIPNVPPAATNAIKVSVGYANIVLKADGTVVTWSSYQPFWNPSLPLTNIVSISAGALHCVALRGDGTVFTWGLYNRGVGGMAYLPTEITNGVQVASQWDVDLVLLGDGSPAITIQPLDRNLKTGETAALHAREAGRQPMAYQWFLNGNAVSGATDHSLAFTNARLADAGFYQVVISNSVGMATSRVAQVTVTAGPPVISSQPQPITALGGSTVNFHVGASGLGPFSYQWRQRATNNLGSNSDLLTLAQVSRSNSGLYSVVVSNDFGSTTSSNAQLRVLVPQLFSQPVVLPNGSVNITSGDCDGGFLTSNYLSGFTAQASSNLVNWVTVTNSLTVTNGMLLLTDPQQTNFSQRFYRIVEQ